MATWLPVLVVVITAAASILGYLLQKRIDARSALIKLRQDAYTHFLASLVVHVDVQTKETSVKYHVSQMHLFAVASDSVLEAAGAFQSYMDKTSGPEVSRDPETYRKLFADMIVTMRRDCFEHTRLDEKAVTELLPFN